MSDGKAEDTFIENEKANGKLNKYVQTILNVNKQVHGAGDVQVSMF